MSNYYESAPDQFITIKGILYAYRRFGKEDGVPLFLHMHFRGTMDHWDPAFINPLATARPIIIFDSAGVGRSEGEIPVTFASWAKMALDFFEALGLKEVDVFGFSMGGCTAQLIALNAHKGLVRKLVLAGTVPSGGEGVVRRNPPTEYNVLRLAKTKDEQHHAFLISFFSKSEKSQAEGQAAWERIQNARSHPVDYIEVETAKRQSVASQSFYDLEKTGEGSYNRLHELTIPVLIANG
jgi:pimeloyl-ACP methyl ester carboxylesterase